MIDDIIKEIETIAGSIDDDPFYSEDKTDIYIITTGTSDSFYIGMSKDAEVRKKQHLHALSKKTHHNKNLQRAFNKKEELSWAIFPIPDRELASEIELHLIVSNIDKPNCLNICTQIAPDWTGRTHSDETKKKISEGIKKSWTGERKERAAEIKKEYWEKITPEQKDVHVKSIKRINENPEFREKQLASQKAYWSNQEAREKQSQIKKDFFNNGGKPTWLGKRMDPNTFKKLQEGKENFQNSLTEQERSDFNKKRTEKQCIPIQAGDVTYGSIKEAAEATGISPASVRKRLSSKNFTDWHRK